MNALMAEIWNKIFIETMFVKTLDAWLTLFQCKIYGKDVHRQQQWKSHSLDLWI